MQENKIIWITGASSGIGKALSIKFANEDGMWQHLLDVKIYLKN